MTEVFDILSEASGGITEASETLSEVSGAITKAFDIVSQGVEGMAEVFAVSPEASVGISGFLAAFAGCREAVIPTLRIQLSIVSRSPSDNLRLKRERVV